MEREKNEIKREIDYCWKSMAYADANCDGKGARFALGHICGLERALKILQGGDAMVDEFVESWWAANQ